MNCPICKGELLEKEESYKMGSVGIPYSCFKCGKCGEELVFEKDAEETFQNIAKIKEEQHYRKKVTITGNSLAITIPRKLANYLHLKKQSVVDIIATKDGFNVKI